MNVYLLRDEIEEGPAFLLWEQKLGDNLTQPVHAAAGQAGYWAARIAHFSRIARATAAEFVNAWKTCLARKSAKVCDVKES